MAAPSYSAAYRMSGESSVYGHIGKSPSLGHEKRVSPPLPPCRITPVPLIFSLYLFEAFFAIRIEILTPVNDRQITVRIVAIFHLCLPLLSTTDSLNPVPRSLSPILEQLQHPRRLLRDRTGRELEDCLERPPRRDGTISISRTMSSCYWGKKGEGRVRLEENERTLLRGRAVDSVNRNGIQRSQNLDLRLPGATRMETATGVKTRRRKGYLEEGQTTLLLDLYTPLLRCSQLRLSFALVPVLPLRPVGLEWLLKHLHPRLFDHLLLNPNILPLNRPPTRTKKTTLGLPI